MNSGSGSNSGGITINTNTHSNSNNVETKISSSAAVVIGVTFTVVPYALKSLAAVTSKRLAVDISVRCVADRLMQSDSSVTDNATPRKIK